jgi:hypothetical protein
VASSSHRPVCQVDGRRVPALEQEVASAAIHLLHQFGVCSDFSRERNPIVPAEAKKI